MKRVLASPLALLVSLSLARAASLPPPAAPVAPVVAAARPQDAAAEFAVVDVGSTAPDFAFESPTGWLHLHDLRLQGHVLLVIAPDEAVLAALQRERAALHRLSVLPVAVLDRKPSATRAIASRLRLDYPLLPDPRRVIGEQFNALDPDSRADAPAWFVLDREGRVKDLGREGWPGAPWAVVSARALGEPLEHPLAPAASGERGPQVVRVRH